METKIYSVIFTISAILAFALIATGISTTAFVNVLAQEGAITPEGSVNDTMSGQNASQWATNATLAFAQEGFQTEDLINETIDMGNNTATSNATLAYAQGEGNATQSQAGNATQSQAGGNMTGLTQGQISEDDDNGDEGEDDDDDKDNGDDKDDKDKE
jgi:hypothetical protein